MTLPLLKHEHQDLVSCADCRNKSWQALLWFLSSLCTTLCDVDGVKKLFLFEIRVPSSDGLNETVFIGSLALGSLKKITSSVARRVVHSFWGPYFAMNFIEGTIKLTAPRVSAQFWHMSFLCNNWSCLYAESEVEFFECLLWSYAKDWSFFIWSTCGWADTHLNVAVVKHLNHNQ